MLTLSQFKEMYPPQAGARLLASRANCMAEFNKMIVDELSFPAPATMTGVFQFTCYERLTHAGRLWYWAKQKRNLVRQWRKYLSDLAVRVALAAEAEGRVQQ